MKHTSAVLGMVVAASVSWAAEGWAPEKTEERDHMGRKLEIFSHGVKEAWGYVAPQTDTFYVLHPKEPRDHAPLYVVLHSAGHDVKSCLACTRTPGNHDIYHAPEDFLALYLDCRANKGDWWWGIKTYGGPELGPTDKRVMDTVGWVIGKYGVDPDRVYLCGNSMGGSGTLGIGMRHGDVFAAIKANVPARVEHVSNRMGFPPHALPAGVKLPDPPICVDYSAPNDSWSVKHEAFVAAMNARKYALFFYWGPFGHANNDARILKVNDLVHSFDWLGVRRDEVYPVFTDASTNDPLPWPDNLADTKPGQVNAFLRWKTLNDSAPKIELSLLLVNPTELKTSFSIPSEATANVSLRRLQQFRPEPGETVDWAFGDTKGTTTVDSDGCITVPSLRITAQPVTLCVSQ